MFLGVTSGTTLVGFSAAVWLVSELQSLNEEGSRALRGAMLKDGFAYLPSALWGL